MDYYQFLYQRTKLITDYLKREEVKSSFVIVVDSLRVDEYENCPKES